ncbi:MAG: putative F420-0 ABC transporter permease subunit [Nocardioides sp.]|uniref:putative F420-0 ABC transporter permease subunit n=1 Tax=Nocardioides sp. TaxID=35761 RepID=UPI003F088945
MSSVSLARRQPRAVVASTAVRAAVVWVLALAALPVSILGAVTIGAADLTAAQVWGSISHHLFGTASELSVIRDGIVWELRLPRVLTAGAVGAGLAISGVVMQALTRNPLADPYLLGLSSGASLGAVLVLLTGLAVALPVAAFSGAMLALAGTLLLARALGAITPSRTVLSGLAVSSFAGAITSLVIFWNTQGDSYRQILNWLLGSLASADWGSVAIGWVTLLVVGVPVVLGGRVLDAFAFGDSAAAALGVAVSRTRWLLLTGTALLTGAMVSVSGSIGFVGLVLPNAVRLLVGARHALLLPLSALVGAVFMIWVDTAARTLFEPRELPVGIITVLIGAPVFVAVLVRNRERA